MSNQKQTLYPDDLALWQTPHGDMVGGSYVIKSMLLQNGIAPLQAKRGGGGGAKGGGDGEQDGESSTSKWFMDGGYAVPAGFSIINVPTHTARPAHYTASTRTVDDNLYDTLVNLAFGGEKQSNSSSSSINSNEIVDGVTNKEEKDEEDEEKDEEEEEKDEKEKKEGGSRHKGKVNKIKKSKHSYRRQRQGKHKNKQHKHTFRQKMQDSVQDSVQEMQEISISDISARGSGMITGTIQVGENVYELDPKAMYGLERDDPGAILEQGDLTLSWNLAMSREDIARIANAKLTSFLFNGQPITGVLYYWNRDLNESVPCK